MNAYLLGLVVYMVLIMPVRISFRFRTGRRPGYLLRVQAVGLPFYRRRRDEDPGDETPIDRQEMRQRLHRADPRALRILLARPVRRSIARAVQLEWLSVYAHISQPNAAQTALLYGSLRALALQLQQHRLPLRVHLRADMLGQGSEVLLRCIVSLRLGSLLPAAIAWLRQTRRASKEENYAASH